MKANFLIIGGDKRNEYLAEILRNDGFNVETFGLPCSFCKPLKELVNHSDYIIGPTPCHYDSNIAEAFESFSGEKIFFAGRINAALLDLAKTKNIITEDILEREELAILNAIPSAEGSIQIALKEMPITLHGSKVMVVGYGRIGKILCKTLLGFGAEVFAVSRKLADDATIKSFGYHSARIFEIDKFLGEMDLIINTVPSLIFDETKILKLKKDCLLIELASKPYGIDFECCMKNGITAILAEGMPGKIAPKTAAIYIKETILNILAEK